MKRIAMLVLSVISCQVSVFGQGSLTPSGAPAPTMKTLEQVEPRMPISALPFTITQPGSYFVTTNLTGNPGGITIAASGVTLDLMGFELVGGTGHGIFVSELRTNVVIRNGTVRRWGSDGVSIGNAFGALLEGLHASRNGLTGINARLGSVITRCTATGNLIGIAVGQGCTVIACAAYSNTENGIEARSQSVVVNCTAQSNGQIGILLDDSNVRGCAVSFNGSYGIFQTGTGGHVSDCTVSLSTGDGIRVLNDCVVINNVSVLNGNAGDGAGITATGSRNRIVGNHVSRNDRGLDIDGAGNYIANNTVVANTDNYDIVAGNQVNLLLGQLPETIDVSANVMLSGTLTGVTAQAGITISASDVMIDLGGHGLVGVPGSLDGINVSVAVTNLTVRNGSVRNWSQDGIDAANARNGRYLGVSTSGNSRSGLITGISSVLDGCTSDSDCLSSIVDDAAIKLGDASIVRACMVTQSRSDGIKASRGVLISGCSVRTATFDGIEVDTDCTVEQNLVVIAGLGASDGAGIHVTGAGNRIDGNNVQNCDRGIDANPATGSLIIRNSAKDNTVEYDIAGGNLAGAISVNPATAGPWDNFDF